MEIEQLKKRTRLFSDANTQVEENMTHENISVDVRPLQDPDCPPEMSLDLDSVPYQDQDTGEQGPDLPISELPSNNRVRDRQRSKSLDVSFTILSFMERKIRERVMSQELSPTEIDKHERK